MPTKYTGDEPTRVALDTFIKLARASDSVVAGIFGREPRPLPDGLTPSQFAVLEALHHGGAMCAGEVAAKVLKSKGNMTTVIDHLERDGLVTRERDGLDRRRTNLILTARGHAVIGETFPRVAEAIRVVFATLTSDEQQQLGELCKKLGRGNAASAQETSE